MIAIIALLIAICNVNAQDPAPSWVKYAHASCPAGSPITHLSATTIVPPPPAEIGGYPALWFGIEDVNNINLLQPIVPTWGQCEINEYCVYNEQFRWHGQKNWDGDSAQIVAGDLVYASIDLAQNGSYILTIAVNNQTLFADERDPSVLEGLTFVNAYFVVEHGAACNMLPMHGITYSNIELSCNGTTVQSPNWSVHSETLVCEMDAKVIDPQTIAFTWSNQDSQ